MPETYDPIENEQYRTSEYPGFGLRRVQSDGGNGDGEGGGFAGRGASPGTGAISGKREGGGGRGFANNGVYHGDTLIDTDSLGFKAVDKISGGLAGDLASLNNEAYYSQQQGVQDTPGMTPDGLVDAPSQTEANTNAGYEGGGGGMNGDTGGGYSSDPNGSQACFVAGTPVLMADGTEKPIERIREGDEVAAFDGLNALESRKVKHLMVHRNRRVLLIVAGHSSVRCTPEHPFLIEHGTWRTAGDLKPGDRLIDADGNPQTVASVDGVTGEHDVFNFHVEDLQTYVAAGFRVHNTKGQQQDVVYDAGGPVGGMRAGMMPPARQPANLQTGEFVIRRQAAMALGPDILAALNDPEVAAQVGAMIRGGDAMGGEESGEAGGMGAMQSLTPQEIAALDAAMTPELEAVLSKLVPGLGRLLAGGGGAQRQPPVPGRGGLARVA